MIPEGRINSTDPDSRMMIQKGHPRCRATTRRRRSPTARSSLAAEITTRAGLRAAWTGVEPRCRTGGAGVEEQPATVLADAGYWHSEQMEAIDARGMPVLIPPDGKLREGERPGGAAGDTRSCAACSRPSTAGALRRAQARSSRCSARSNQPPDRSVPTKRPSSRTVGMATRSQPLTTYSSCTTTRSHPQSDRRLRGILPPPGCDRAALTPLPQLYPTASSWRGHARSRGCRTLAPCALGS